MGTAPYEVIYSGSDRSKFLHARRDGVGASDVAAVLGFSRFRTPYDVWADKTGRAPEKEQTQAMEWGIALERVVAERFSVRHGHRDRAFPIGKVRPSPGVLRSTLWPFMLATPDRLIDEFERPEEEGPTPLEIKTSTAWLASDWANGATPLYYRAQSQSQQLVMFGEAALSTLSDFEAHGWIAPLIGGNDMPEPRKEPFDRAFAEVMVEGVERFWVDHVRADVPPPLTMADDVNEHFPAARGSQVSVDATPEILALVEERRVLAARQSEDKKRDDELKQQIKMHMREAVALKDGAGNVVVTWALPKVQPSSQEVVDLEALQKAHPGIAREFTTVVTSEQSRTMRFPKVKEQA